MTKVETAKKLLARHPGRQLSEVLRDLATGDRGRVSVGEIVSALRDRSFAPLLVIFAAPNVFLFIPGSSVFTALPLMLLGIQLLLGRPEVWLPRPVADRSIDQSVFRRIVTTTVPYIEKVERMAKPRRWPTSFLVAERMIGGATLILSVLLFLPIPFANGIPALSIIVLALGLSQRDGLWLTGGLFMALVSLVLVTGIFLVGATAVLGLFG